MKCTIVTVGDEILIGQIVDTNSAWISTELNLLGVEIKEILSVSDNEEAIKEAINRSLAQSDLVLMTGGLGPTKDDITKKSLIILVLG
jgi:nicotinamide-nucleotide amidase